MDEYPIQPLDNQPGNGLIRRRVGWGLLAEDGVQEEDGEDPEEPIKPDRADSGISGSNGSTPEPEHKPNPGEKEDQVYYPEGVHQLN